MTISKSIALLATTLGAMLVVGQVLSCEGNCEPGPPMESGDYVILPPSSGHVYPGDEWVIGGEVHVDREAEVATIRYTSEGTTYEVRYTLVTP